MMGLFSQVFKKKIKGFIKHNKIKAIVILKVNQMSVFKDIFWSRAFMYFSEETGGWCNCNFEYALRC